jgi:type III secretion protein K
MMDTSARQMSDLMSRSPGLFAHIYAFNFRPADYVHVSRRGQFADGIIDDAIWDEPRARQALSAYILQELGVEELFCFEDERPEWPMVLLGDADLVNLARYVGAVILGPLVRRSLVRDEVLRWKERLTPTVYQFVMTSANLLRAIPVPENLDTEADVEAIGFGVIEASMHEAPKALRRRAQLKLPVNSISIELDQEPAHYVVKAVLSALEPQWCSSFVIRPN